MTAPRPDPTPADDVATVLHSIAAPSPAMAWLLRVGPVARQLHAEMIAENEALAAAGLGDTRHG